MESIGGQSVHISDASRPRRRTTPWAAAGLVLAATVCSLLLLEGLMRAFRVVPERHRPARWLTYYRGAFVDGGDWGERIEPGRSFQRRMSPPEWGYDVPLFVPGARMKLVYDSNPRGYFDRENGVEMRVNGSGYRGPEAGPKRPGTFRILGLGDSFAFGEGVRDQDTFLRGLETRLNAGRAPDQPVEVLNLGMGGYSIQDGIVVLEKQWLPLGLAPDLVLITFYVNDAVEGVDERGVSAGLYRDREGLGRISYLWDYLSFRLQARESRRRYQAWFGSELLEDPAAVLRAGGPRAGLWSGAEARLRELKSLSERRRFAVGVVIFPDLYRLKSGHPFAALYAMVEQVCRELGFPVLNLYPAFAGSGHAEEDLWVHPTDHHPNEIAHAIAAREISRFVEQTWLAGPDRVPSPRDRRRE